MTVVLVLTSVVIMLSILLNKISERVGMPVLLAFILLGMLFGSDGLFKIRFDDFKFAEIICSTALIFIMFYGGFGTRWSAARKIAVKAVLLSSLGVFLTALLTSLFCFRVLDINFLESCLLGAVLSSTDAASVFSILRYKRLALKHNTDSLLEVESGSNDPAAYLLVMVVLAIMSSQTGVGSILYLTFAQIFFGAVGGVLIAYAAVWLLNHLRFDIAGFDAAFMLAVAIFSYALPALIGGNGYLSAYIVGVIVGNKIIPNKKALVHFFDGTTSLMQILIFFLLGLLAFPSRLGAIFGVSLAIALFMTFIARPLVVAAILRPFKSPPKQIAVVSWAGLRGAASIVFAIVATVNYSQLEHDLFHMVFCIVLLSIALQGSLLPWLSKQLNMIDSEGDVFKTFNDYSDETEMQFIRLQIRKGHEWVGKRIKDLVLPPQVLIVLLERAGGNIVPNGDTILAADDVLVLSALAYHSENGIRLSEVRVEEGDKWCGKRVYNLPLPKGTLILMLFRDGTTVIPRGNTQIYAGDVLVMNKL